MGTVFVRADDGANYERLCRLLLARPIQEPGLFENEIEAASMAERYTKLCCLKPQNLRPEARATVLELSRYALANARNDVGWPVLAGGVAEYHFGQPDQALALLRRAEQDNDPLISGTAKLYHAMMLQKLNHSTEAADLLKEAEQRFAERDESVMPDFRLN